MVRKKSYKIFIHFCLFISFIMFFIVPSANSAELDEISKAIKEKKARWVAKETQISKLILEKQKRHLGAIIPTITGKEKVMVVPETTLPVRVDWRDYGSKSYVTPVKEQGDCGACWAFAASSALESSLLISRNLEGIFFDLSEQTAISCSGAGTCSDGLIDIVSDFIRDTGLPDEGCYPYTSSDNSCANACFDWQYNTYKISDWYRVEPIVDSIKYALYHYGPLVATMAVYTDFLYYGSGIYTNSWGAFEGYHTVVIVGYDDAEQCFIVKNSWGTDWGESGFFRIAYSELNSNILFGYWTIAYENQVPDDFPEIDDIPRTKLAGQIEEDKNKGKDEPAVVSILKGNVNDQSGNSIAGAEIKLGKYSTLTDAHGQYSLSVVNPGNYIAVVRKNGYSSLSESVNIPPSSTIMKNFILSPYLSMDSQSSQSAIKNQLNDSDPDSIKPVLTSNPGWHFAKPIPVSLEEAMAYYEAEGKKNASIKKSSQRILTSAILLSATSPSPEIEELARALRYDPKLIYDYVHNYIDYVPYYGSLKGATLTYLDGSGNDFDQASLMIALLRASGYTAQYVFGMMGKWGDDYANWLGVDQNKNSITNVLASGGIPVFDLLDDGTGFIYRVWVEANINGVDYVFDPAYKYYEYKSKIDIGQATSYSQSELISTATTGADIGSDYVRNLNEANLRNKLATYSSNLVNSIHSQYPNHEVKEIIGGRSIIQTNLTEYSTSLPLTTPLYEWDEIPPEYTAKLRIQHVGIDSTINIHDLSGKRLTITYAGSDHHPELLLDGELIAAGTATTLGSKYNLTITINHPYAANDGTYGDQNSIYEPESGRTYAIIYGFGESSGTFLQKRQLLLDTYLVQGLPNTSEAVLGETLNIMGLSWLKEFFTVDKLLSWIAETVTIQHHAIGLVAQEAGYYIDVKMWYCSIISKHNNDIDPLAHFKELTLIGSSLEHGILEQLMGSNNPGVSTIKLFQIANATGRKVYRVDSSNFTTIEPQLQNYSQADLNDFQAKVNNGYTLILPDNGQLVLGQWKGKGYISKYFSEAGGHMEMAIGGGYYGGYVYNPISVDTDLISLIIQEALYTTSNYTYIGFQSNDQIKPELTKEPVDTASGAYLHDNVDFSLGGNTPSGLTFARSYDSRLNFEQKTLGFGWTHNFDIYLSRNSHGDPGLGSRQPVDVASLIAELYIALDFLRNYDDILGWMITSLSSKWAVDQLIDNAITVHFGKNVMEFIKLPDGTYASPPGITTQLVKNGDGTFSLKERFGTQIDFNANDRILRIRDVDGNAMTFTYSGDNLNSVKDVFGRSLTFTYTGDKLTKVSDSSGRSVLYSYDTNGNLITYTDPQSKKWRYTYDTSHRMASLENPLLITTATNTYDTLGRVKTQTVPRQGGNNVTYNFYFSGFINIEEDPDGNSTVYYFDDKGRPIGGKNALGHMTTKTYDGQNHKIKVVDPKLYSTTFVYDGQNNLIRIKNALERETVNTYDSQFRLTDITDPLNHNTHFDYDSEHHLILTEDAEGNQTSSAYYANGLKETATDGRGTVTKLTHDLYGNPKTENIGNYPLVTHSYNSIGWLNNLTDQVGSTTGFVYDKRGLLISKTDPLGKTITFTYDNVGRLLTKTDRNNQTVSYTYTPTGKLDTITYPDTTTKFSYNQHDDLVGMEDSIGNTSYTYNAIHHLKSSTNPHGFTVVYTYDKNGNLIELTYPGGDKVIYTYNKLNQLKTVKIDWLNQTATYNYDAAGLLVRLANFNGTVTTYGYDDADGLISLENKRPDSSIIATYQFILDGNGNRTETIQNEPLAPILNTDTVSYTYNDRKNRLQTAGMTGFGYDDEGQLSSGYGNSFSFDNEHRLVSIGSSSQFLYDGIGNRLKAIRNGVETRYIYDAGGNLLAEADGSNNITKYYIHGLGLMAVVTPTDQVYCYHFNAVGSTIALTDQSQTMVNKHAYDSFGNVVNQEETVPQPFKFVGQHGVMTEPNGFYYMMARYYDPNVGRFISEDPIGFDGGDVNLYGYVGNNPVNLIDSSGLTWLVFEKDSNILYVHPGTTEAQGPPRAFPAGNITDRSSRGPISVGGPYPIGEPIPNIGTRVNRIPSQGPYFIPIYGVDGRSELGIHGGRTGPEYPTMGCIRMNNQDLSDLVNIHRGDSLSTITVTNGGK
jgi:RHS repeat-associated protein